MIGNSFGVPCKAKNDYAAAERVGKERMSIQTIFLVLLGAVVFVIGTTNIRASLRQKNPENTLKGKVLSVKLVEKRDKEERLVQHYYEMMMLCSGGGKTFHEKISSTMEYEKGDEIELVRNGDRLIPFSGKNLTLGMSLAIALAGMGMAVFPIVWQNYGEKEGSVILVLLLILAGVISCSSFLKERKRSLPEISGEIVDILYYRTGDNKKFSKPVTSYYPLIKCVMEEKEKTFLSSYNSSTKGAYKAGKKVKLFYDEENKRIVEKKASPALMVMAVIFWLMALVGIISIFG